MNFCDLLTCLLEITRARVSNGEITERELARRIGISQPYLHHILKGNRALRPAIADRLLAERGLSIPDLSAVFRERG